MDIDGGNKSKRRRLQQKRSVKQNHEIWYEILTRLSLKSLLACRAVCRSWDDKVFCLQQDSKPLPLCGLIIKSTFGLSSINTVDINYVSVITKEVTRMRPDDPKSLIVSVASGGNGENRLMSYLSFDFGGLFERNPSRIAVSCPEEKMPFDFDKLCIDKTEQSQSCFFAVHGGLLLVVHEDGSYLVHNPLTRQVTRLPKPPSFRRYDPKCLPVEKVGFISMSSRSCLSDGSVYHVIRVCRVSKVIEVYEAYKEPQHWRTSKLRLGDDLIQARWYWENNAVVPRYRTLYFLTSKDRGVAIRFGSRHKLAAYGFGLPRLVQEGFENARLGTSEEFIYLSYYNSNGVWIWKHVIGGNMVRSDTWVLLLEVSHYTQLCKPLASQILCNAMSVGGLVVPLAFHPVAAIVFLWINSCIVAYNFDMDTFDKIVEITEIERGSPMVVLPYSPCLASVVSKRLKALKNAPPSQDDVMIN